MRLKCAIRASIVIPFLGVLIWSSAGCALRTVPPVRFVPILGTEKSIDTTDLLMRALQDRDRAVRAEAVDLLGILGQQTGDKKTKVKVAHVLGIAMKDRDPGLRLQAVQKLGQMDGSVANKYLLNALRDPHPFVRTEVLSVIAERERGGSASPPGALSAQIIP